MNDGRVILVLVILPLIMGCHEPDDTYITFVNQTDIEIEDCAIDVFKATTEGEEMIVHDLKQGSQIVKGFSASRWSSRDRTSISLIARPTESFGECSGSEHEDFWVRRGWDRHYTWRIEMRGYHYKTDDDGTIIVIAEPK